jgi:3-hydroxyacyl-[acyl-carrier-protein] dehydratase
MTDHSETAQTVAKAEPEAEAAIEVGSSIDMAEILRRIPHRFPFLLIDRAEDYLAFKSITGVKCVTMNEPYFQGHFPNNPVMPGVLIVEALGQTGAVLMSKSLNADIEGRTILFITVDNCRFRTPVRPGDVLHMKVAVTRYRSDLFKFQGRAFVGSKVAAEADFAAMVVKSE